MQLIHILREWRGAIHLVATTAAGLSPLEAILTNEEEHANDMHDLLVAHEGEPMLPGN